MGDPFPGQRLTGGSHFMTDLDQQIDRALGPGLTHFLEEVGQLPQVMGVAQPMPAQQFAEAIQQAVPEGTVIHQMPTRAFPFGGYEHLQSYLFTKGLRWTCPAMLNRRGMRWCEELERLPAEAMLERLRDHFPKKVTQTYSVFPDPSSGDVIDVKTRQVIAQLTDEQGRSVGSEKMLEIDWDGDTPVRAGNQFGVGRVTE